MRKIILLLSVFYLILLQVVSSADIPTDILNRGKRATALVQLPEEQGFGTAFCIDPAGIFVTNAHVANVEEEGQRLKIVLYPGEKDQKTVFATVIKQDDDLDLALLQVDTSINLTALELGDSDTLSETLSVTAFGYPFGTDLAVGQEEYPSVTVSTGHITALRKSRGRLTEIQLDATLNPGNSGGPVLDAKGQVIGIVKSGILGTGVNFAIPVKSLQSILKPVLLLFAPPYIPLNQEHKSQDFLIRVATFGKEIPDLKVSLALTPERGKPRVFQSVDNKKHLISFTAVPVPEPIDDKYALPAKDRSYSFESAEDAARILHYTLLAKQAGKTVQETSGVFVIGKRTSTGQRSALHPAGRKAVVSFTCGVLFAVDDMGKYDGNDYWTTGTGSASHLFFRQGNRWLNAKEGTIDIPLTPGLHTFQFYAEPVNSLKRFGLNLFFDQNDLAPGITVFALTAQSKSEDPAFDTTEAATMRPDTKGAPGAGTLSYDLQHARVEIVRFRIEAPAVESLDVVNRETSESNGVLDLVGSLTLKVTLK